LDEEVGAMRSDMHLSSRHMAEGSGMAVLASTLIMAAVYIGGCKTAYAARQEREIRAKAAHKAAYQKPPLEESATAMWWDGHWQEVLSTVAGVLATTLAVIRKGRRG